MTAPRLGNLAALLAAGSMALPPPALGGGACYSGARATTYAAPAYSYNYQAYSYAAPAYVAPQVVVQQALYPAYSFQVLDAYQPEPVRAKVVQAPAKLDDAALEAIAERVVTRIAPALTAATVTGPAPSPQSGWGLDGDELPPPTKAPAGAYPAPPPPLANPQSQSSAPTPREGFSQAEVESLGAACYRCHNPQSSKGKLALFDQEGRWAPAYSDGRQVDPAVILEAVTSHDGVTPPAMPKGATSDRSTWLGPAAVAALERWAQGG